MTILYLIVLLFASIGILFLFGKGSWLIAGYNTASQQQKQHYDEDKLMRIMGIGMLAFAVLLFLMAIGVLKQAIVIAIIGIVIGLFIAVDLIASDEHHLQKATKAMIAILLTVGIGMEGCMHAGTITSEYQQNGIYLAGMNMRKRVIDYDDIVNIQFTNYFDVGSRKKGWGSYQLQLGTFENDLGEYELYAYTDCHTYILVQTKDGLVVFNKESKEATLESYNILKLKLGYRN